MKSSRLLIGRLLVAAIACSLAGLAGSTAFSASAALPALTPTPTPTPSVEPELAILQYVIDHNSSWSCQGPFGTPGHRYISNCLPLGNFSHPTSGYVDNYGTPQDARAQWTIQRTNAFSTYPIHGDQPYGPYQGYYAGNENYPYAHYENYFWGDVWVMGAVSSDDTHFYGSPYVAGAIYQAAVALGYLGSPTPTPLPTNTFTPTPTPWTGSGFYLFDSPSLPADSSLAAMDVVTSTDVWAVGYYTSTGKYNTLVERWNGTAWNVVPSPNQGTGNNFLQGVSAFADDDAWAVGYYYPSGSQYPQTLAMHWNGSAWSIEFTPNYGTTSSLYGVGMVAANDVWAVGTIGSQGNQSFILHYDGTTWSIAPSPPIGYQGTTDVYLRSISAISATDIWAAGYFSPLYYNRSTLMLHWNGTTWTQFGTPNPGFEQQFLYGVSAVASNDVWGVGYYHESSTPVWATLTIHWNGSTWSQVPSPNPVTTGSYPANYLYGVSATTSNDVWAVGEYVNQYTNGRTMVLHWDGSSWTLANSENNGTNNNALSAVAGVSSTDAWACGSYVDSVSGQTHSLVERYIPAGTATYTPTNTHTPTPAPTCGLTTNYEITPSTGATIVPGTTLVPGSQANDAVANITLPFNYFLYGQNFISVRADTNGNLQFTGGASTPFNQCLPPNDPNFQNVIMPYWDDLDTSASIDPGLGIYTSISGSQPNRVFNIEWRACRFNGGTCGGSANFEVRLYEGQERFDFIYGNMDDGGTSATVGVLARRSFGFTQWSCNTASVQQGLLLDFQEHGCANPTFTPTWTPTGQTTPTVTPTGTGTPCTITFTDVQPADYFYEAVSYLYCHGIISGYADNTFRPYNNATRSQLTKIVVLAEGWPIVTPSGTPTFSDVPPDNPFYQYVETAYSHAIISGYADGTFRPYNNVTRGQLCKIVVLAEGWTLLNPPTPTFTDVPTSNPFYREIETAYSHAIISGYADGTFRPGNNATRGQISKIVYNAVTQP